MGNPYLSACSAGPPRVKIDKWALGQRWGNTSSARPGFQRVCELVQTMREEVAYRSSVKVADLCPSISCTILTSVPEAIARLAAI